MSLDKQALQAFIEQTLLLSFEQDVKQDENLFDSGFLDSYGYIEIIKFAENHYNIQFTDDDLVSPEMTSLTGILTVVEKRQKSSE